MPAATHFAPGPAEVLETVALPPLMRLSRGHPSIAVGIIDGPVRSAIPTLRQARLQGLVPGSLSCRSAGGLACLHGTFITGMLASADGCRLPGICPECTFLVRPIFGERGGAATRNLVAEPDDVADAIIGTVDAGARILNMSVALTTFSGSRFPRLDAALDHAMRNDVIVVVAAGNQGTLGGSVFTQHPWTIPVVAVQMNGRPIDYSNLGISIGRKGLAAPGDHVRSYDPKGSVFLMGGTSAAAPFVTGAIALLWSLVPEASAAEVMAALIGASTVAARRSIVPPRLNAWGAWQRLAATASAAPGATSPPRNPA